MPPKTGGDLESLLNYFTIYLDRMQLEHEIVFACDNGDVDDIGADSTESVYDTRVILFIQ